MYSVAAGLYLTGKMQKTSFFLDISRIDRLYLYHGCNFAIAEP
jgi:hypothetical protein